VIYDASSMTATVVDRLCELVRFDTRNPGGDEAALATILYEQVRALEADEVDLERTPNGHAYVVARYGTPRLLVNAHLDTVPAAPGWSRPPLEPHLAEGRVTGLGAADTKGALAAILGALSQVRPRDTMILFSGDEEHGGTCMRTFLQSGRARGLERAVVCEPTRLRPGTRHRGVMAFAAEVAGPGGHSSRADELPRPLAELARLAVAIDDWGREMLAVGPPGFRGMCTNVAELRGGVAFNVIPTGAELLWSVRPPPGTSLDSVEQAMIARLPPGARLRVTLKNAAFATRDREAFRPLLGARVDSPIDLGFWTEAAMLSEAGIDAVVFGPGDIAQAHAPDEWVEVAELAAAEQTFVEMFRGSV
jgi:acetylornithine deacetylase